MRISKHTDLLGKMEVPGRSTLKLKLNHKLVFPTGIALQPHSQEI